MTFGEALHNQLKMLDDKGDAYAVSVDGGMEADVYDHAPTYLMIRVNDAKLNHTDHFFNLALVKTVAVREY